MKTTLSTLFALAALSVSADPVPAVMLTNIAAVEIRGVTVLQTNGHYQSQIMTNGTAADTNMSSVSLAWDPSPSPEAIGYNIYTGIDTRVYTNRTDASNATTITLNVPRTTNFYYFTATAYDVKGLESDYSNEVMWSPQPPTNVIVTATILASSNLVNWEPVFTGATITITNPSMPMNYRALMSIRAQ